MVPVQTCTNIWKVRKRPYSHGEELELYHTCVDEHTDKFVGIWFITHPYTNAIYATYTSEGPFHIPQGYGLFTCLQPLQAPQDDL